MLVDFRERVEGGRGQKTSSVCLSYTPQQGPNPQRRHVTWLQSKPMIFQLTEWHLNQLSHTGQSTCLGPCAWFVGSVPGWACMKGNQVMFLSLAFCLHPPLSKKKKKRMFKTCSTCSTGLFSLRLSNKNTTTASNNGYLVWMNQNYTFFFPIWLEEKKQYISWCAAEF